MSTFGSAFLRGKEAFENAARAKAEIQEVFTQLSNEILTSTDQLVSVQFGTFSKSKVLPRLSGPLTDLLPETYKYDALVAVANKDWGNSKELCTVTISADGYPVTLTFPGNFFRATDRESLVQALIKMMEHPDVAGAIALLHQTALRAKPTPAPL